MTRATAEERALARAAIYRLLASAFSYPTTEAVAALRGEIELAGAAAELMDAKTADGIAAMTIFGAAASRDGLEVAYQSTFTLSYNEDCPLYETAFSARHIFQQTQQQADIAGFYRAFGVDSRVDRPDHLAIELEFLALLALKEAWARERGETDHISVCREAQRAFVRDHLGRWAPQIAGRIAVAARGTLYEEAARLLLAFVEHEVRFLRLGTFKRFSDEPVLIADEPGEFTCPMEEAPVQIQPMENSEEGHDVPLHIR